jgi:hypothetical protein
METRLAITKENQVSPIKFHFETASENTTVASTVAQEEWLSKHESRETFYSNLQMGMGVNSSRYIPIAPVTKPSLDGTHTLYLCMFLENWKVEAICRFVQCYLSTWIKNEYII